MNPISPQTQKNQTESSNRLELAPPAPTAACRQAMRSGPIRNSGPLLRTDLQMMEYLASTGPKAFFHPNHPNEPHKLTNPKKPNRVIESARTGTMVPTAACRQAMRSGPIRNNGPLLRTDLQMMDPPDLTGPKALFHPNHPNEPHEPTNQKKQTESSNRLELAPPAPTAACRQAMRSGPIRNNRPLLRTDLQMMEHPGLKGRRHSFTPIIRMNPMNQNPLKQTKQSHGRISNCARSARACLPLG